MKTNTVEKKDYTQEKIYQEAIQGIDDLVEAVVNICDEVAEKITMKKNGYPNAFRKSSVKETYDKEI